MGRLERASAIAVARGAVARVAWYAFDRPCAWSLRACDRARVAWSGARDDAFDARATVDDDAEAILLEALREADAGKTTHVRGTFEAHLTCARDWLRDALDAPAACATAGLGHSAYGSELFPVRLAGFGRDRAFFARACGEAEVDAAASSRMSRGGGGWAARAEAGGRAPASPRSLRCARTLSVAVAARRRCLPSLLLRMPLAPLV